MHAISAHKEAFKQGPTAFRSYQLTHWIRLLVPRATKIVGNASVPYLTAHSRRYASEGKPPPPDRTRRQPYAYSSDVLCALSHLVDPCFKSSLVPLLTRSLRLPGPGAEAPPWHHYNEEAGTTNIRRQEGRQVDSVACMVHFFSTTSFYPLCGEYQTHASGEQGKHHAQLHQGRDRSARHPLPRNAAAVAQRIHHACCSPHQRQGISHGPPAR